MIMLNSKEGYFQVPKQTTWGIYCFLLGLFSTAVFIFLNMTKHKYCVQQNYASIHLSIQ